MFRLLDLFCGAGGAAMGYHQALEELGIEHTITGIDNKPMPRYPFEFIQADALEYLAKHGREYDFIHASPPCQGYSRLRHLPWLKDRVYPLLIAPVHELLIEISNLWVIENVADSPLNGAELCGAALGLQIRRHRRFESNQLLLFPACPGHPAIDNGSIAMATKYRGSGVTGIYKGCDPKIVMEIDWMNREELKQAIPPAYTRFIGLQLFRTHEQP